MLNFAVKKILKMCDHGTWIMGRLIQAPLKPVQCHLFGFSWPFENMYLKAVRSTAVQVWDAVKSFCPFIFTFRFLENAEKLLIYCWCYFSILCPVRFTSSKNAYFSPIFNSKYKKPLHLLQYFRTSTGMWFEFSLRCWHINVPYKFFLLADYPSIFCRLSEPTLNEICSLRTVSILTVFLVLLCLFISFSLYVHPDTVIFNIFNLSESPIGLWGMCVAWSICSSLYKVVEIYYNFVRFRKICLHKCLLPTSAASPYLQLIIFVT